MTTDRPTQLAALDAAITMLDSEEHRYVERFGPCPNGCVYNYADAVYVAGQMVPWPPNTPPVLVQTAGPAHCDRCDLGSIEDENAPWLNPQVSALRDLAAALTETP